MGRSVRGSNKPKVFVRITKFTESPYEDDITVGIAGAVFQRVVGKREDLAWNNRVYQAFRAVPRVDFIFTQRLVGFHKEADADWSTIVPIIETVLGTIFGKELHISKRSQRQMSWKTLSTLSAGAQDRDEAEADAFYG